MNQCDICKKDTSLLVYYSDNIQYCYDCFHEKYPCQNCASLRAENEELKQQRGNFIAQNREFKEYEEHLKASLAETERDLKWLLYEAPMKEFTGTLEQYKVMLNKVDKLCVKYPKSLT